MKAAIHEMRNHLSVAMASIEAFLDRKLEPSDERLSAVFAALHEVDSLIDDLPNDQTVTFATHVVSIDVCRLIASQVTAMEGFAAECGVRLTAQRCEATHAECAVFLGDPIRIAEIVTNVLINAIRFTPSGGEVHVECSRDSANVRFTIADEGPGIHVDDRLHIFERGYRGRSVPFASGSGIGLALVKQFVDCQGGTIQISDGQLGGSVFTITLPGKRHEKTCGECGEPRARSSALVERRASTSARTGALS